MSQTKGKVSKALLVFLFQPFLGFLVSLRNLDSKAGKFVFVAFATLWGYSQSFSYTPTDGYRIAASFCQYPISSFSAIIQQFAEGKAIDGYLLVTNYLVHLFSNNAKVYFALLGCVFGLLCYSTIVSLIQESKEQESKEKDGKYLTHILFLLFATNSFAWLTAPRYFTASWLAVLIFLKISQGNKKWVWFSLLLPLIHFSFVIVALGLLVITLFGKMFSKFSSLLFILVCVVFVLSFVLPETIIARLIPQELMEENTKLASKYVYISGETNDFEPLGETSAYRVANSAFTSLFHFLMKVGSFITLLYLYFRKKTLNKNSKIWTTYTSILVIACIAYFMSIIPGSGWRYIIVLWLLLYVLLYRFYYQFHPKDFNTIVLLLYGMNIYTIAFMFYVTYRTVNLLLFYAPLPFVILQGIGFPPVFFV